MATGVPVIYRAGMAAFIARRISRERLQRMLFHFACLIVGFACPAGSFSDDAQ